MRVPARRRPSGTGSDCGMRHLVRLGRVPVGYRHLDHRIRHRVEYEAVHGLCIRLLLHQLVDGRLGVRREELVDCPVEALLLLPGRGEHRISTFLFAKHLWVIMIIYLIIGVCQAPTWINGNQLMLHLVPPSRLTEGMAWMGAMNSIGSSAGSAIAGQFIDRMGSHGGFMVVTTLALVSLVIALIGFKQIKAPPSSRP